MSRKEYPLNPKNIFGLSTMRWVAVAGASLMTSAFMIYLTDYSKIANAAAVATILLAFGRILDAVDDPLQGWIMDASRVTRIGKFKPFLLFGIVLATIAIILLFNIPQGIPEWMKIVVLFLGYFMYEIGISFQPDLAIKSTMTEDTVIRNKLLVTPRIAEQFVAVPFSFFITIALVLGKNFGGNNHLGFGLASILFIIPIAIIAFIGGVCIKEGPYVQNQEEKLALREIFTMFKSNKPLWISQLSGIIGGCVFTFVMAAVSYYIKWAYGPDSFGVNSAIYGACILLGIIVGTILAPILFRKWTPSQGAIFCNVAQVVPLAVIFLLTLFGTPNIIIFMALLFVSFVFSGMGYIPGSMVNMECMDYNVWKQGKGLQGMVQAVSSFVGKAQVAIAGLATGAVLVAIQYDAELYESEEFIAAGGTIPPSLLNSLAIVFCLIPVGLGIIAAIIMLLYPLKKKERDFMYQELNQRRIEKNDK